MTAFLDKDIREPLFDFLEENFGKTRIIECRLSPVSDSWKSTAES